MGSGTNWQQEWGSGDGPLALRARGVRLRCLSCCPAAWIPRAASVAGRWGWHARFLTEAPPLAVILSGPLGLPLPSPILGHSSEPLPLWRTGREPGPFCQEVEAGMWGGSRSETVGRALSPQPRPSRPYPLSCMGHLRQDALLSAQGPLPPGPSWSHTPVGRTRFLGPQVHMVDM